MDQVHLSRLSNFLITSFEKEEINNQTKHGINVSRFISEIATWYERFRNAMDYRDEEIVRRAAIERILKRRLLFGGDGAKIAPILIRELLWARYFPESSIPEDDVGKVAKIIDLYLDLRQHLILQKEKLNVDSLIYQLLSSRLEIMLNKNKDIDFISNYIFHILKERVTITDDTLETRDVQMFITVRRTFAKDDIAFLRFRLFEQYFGQLTEANVAHIAANFKKGYSEIDHQINYKLKERISSYVKRQLPPFLIFGEILRKERGRTRELVEDTQRFKEAIFQTAEARYKTIIGKVRRGIIRAVIFILLTKFIFAFSVELSYDNLFLGKVVWRSILMNIFIPPLLMVIASLFIRTPNKKNTERIYERITNILFVENPRLDRPLILSLKPIRKHPILESSFDFLWWATFILSFGSIIYILNKLEFNVASEGVFVFFVALISVFTYRISQTAHSYTVPARQSLFAPLIDFFFMPIIRVGGRLSEGITKINILIYIFDYLIETPFKEIFGFLEQWFFFLQTKREELG